MENGEEEKIREAVSHLSQEIQQCVEGEIKTLVDKSGVYCRIISRVKAQNSIEKKMSKKGYNAYHKMQDILGVRIIFYFNEDVEIFKRYLKHHFRYQYDSESLTLSDIEEAESILNTDRWQLQDKLFMPTRLNVVFRADEDLNDKYVRLFEQLGKLEIATEFIDHTFEVQFRTVLSEGWHEVEHDLRYKCKEYWTGMGTESRFLNGIYASLETNEHAMDLLFKDMARKFYQNKNWEALLRFITRIHISGNISDEVRHSLSENKNISKAILKFDRELLIRSLLAVTPGQVELTMDNVIMAINQLQASNKQDAELNHRAETYEYGIKGIDVNLIRKQIAEEKSQDEIGRLVDRSVRVKTEEDKIDGLIVTIELRKSISQVPTLEFTKVFKKHIGSNNIVVIDVRKVDVLTGNVIKNHILPAMLIMPEAQKSVNIRWDKAQYTKCIKQFKKQLHEAMEELLQGKAESDVVPNSIPNIMIEENSRVHGYRVYLDDYINL